MKMANQLITILKRVYRSIIPKPYGWSGDYASWKDAQKLCTGYDADNILQKVKEAVLKVKNGEAVAERDSVLFDEIEYSWPLLSAVMWTAAKNQGHLQLIDFGGSLGSSYFQNKKFLDGLSSLRWNVVEQDNFVDAGKQFIQDERLRFYHSVEDCIKDQGLPQLLIISCTLQYIEKPYELLKWLCSFDIPQILIDNTPFNYENRDRITIQKVPPAIYTASYPSWFLDYTAIKNIFAGGYELVSEHVNDTTIELDSREIPYRGFLMALKK